MVRGATHHHPLAGPTIPVLRIFDEAKARAYYLDYLGFRLEFEHRFDPTAPLYLSVVRDGCTLHLSEHHGDGTPGTLVRIHCSDVDAFAAELATRPQAHSRPTIEAMPWGTRDLALIDPFGNRVVFSDGG
jgi:uncharacterized glyoxalase superfamily protein PhnB